MTPNKCKNHYLVLGQTGFVTFPTIGKYLDKVDRVMTQVDRITEDIAHMPVAAFIFRGKESDEVHYSTKIRLFFLQGTKLS